jgi:MinD superfamily P-loop ATPase
MVIAVASGKGGTGKTMVATSLALSLDGDVQFLDCDVEEPNARIFLKPEITEAHDVHMPVPHVDESECKHCGLCQEVCAYHAIVVIRQEVLVFPELCHSCGACTLLCPCHALFEADKNVGRIETGTSRHVRFVQGELSIGESTPAPLIKAVKKTTRPSATVIIDCPPGTSCPVIESVKGSDFCVLVTEPTPFGLSDLMLTVAMLHQLGLPFGVVINRANLGTGDTAAYCEHEHIPVLMQIPFRREIAEAYSRGTPLAEAFPEYQDKFRELFREISQLTSAAMPYATAVSLLPEKRTARAGGTER